VGARLERVNEDLEAGRVARQLEQSHDADDAEELEDVVVLLHVGQHVVEVERQSRDEVNDVDRRQSERQFARTDDRPRDQFERKPHVAHTLDVSSTCCQTTRRRRTWRTIRRKLVSKASRIDCRHTRCKRMFPSSSSSTLYNARHKSGLYAEG